MAWTKHRKGRHTPLEGTQRRGAMCPWPHSMLIAYIGPEPRSYLWSGALSMPGSLCSLSRSPNQRCPQESFQCHPSFQSGRPAPQASSLSTTFGCRRKGHGASAKLESLQDGDGAKGHLRLLLGAALIPEQLPALRGYEADPEWRLLF